MKNISEFIPKNYREFYSMQELVSAISRTLKVITWAACGWTKMNKALLRFRVSAHRHKGYVYIAVNGADLFDIWLTNLKGDVKKTFTDVYVEDLITVIDDEIEKMPDYIR
jgi:hypothetical protein